MNDAMRSPAPNWALAAVALLLAVTWGACGGKTSDGGSGGAAGASSATGTTTGSSSTTMTTGTTTTGAGGSGPGSACPVAPPVDGTVCVVPWDAGSGPFGGRLSARARGRG